MALLFAMLCWTATATSFNGLLAARCMSGFAASAGEARLNLANTFELLLILFSEHRSRHRQ